MGILPKEAACSGVLSDSRAQEQERWLTVSWAGLRNTGVAAVDSYVHTQPGNLF